MTSVFGPDLGELQEHHEVDAVAGGQDGAQGLDQFRQVGVGVGLGQVVVP